jgi:hypothetical protein
MEFAAIVVAGGDGTRAGGGLPKQFRILGGEPVLRRSLRLFTDAPLVRSAGHSSCGCRALRGNLKRPAEVSAGGPRRQDTPSLRPRGFGKFAAYCAAVRARSRLGAPFCEFRFD